MKTTKQDGQEQPFTEDEQETYRQFDEQMKDPAARAAFTAAVEQGRQDIAAGRFIEHDDLDAELDRILKAAAQPK